MKFVAKWIMEYLQKRFNPLKVSSISSKELNNIFKFEDVANIHISDKQYNLCKPEDIHKFLGFNIFKFRQYVPEKYDCDNYSFSLMGLFTNLMSGYAIGIVWAKTGKNTAHALNFFLDDKRTIWFIEPQTNAMFPYNPKGRYKPYLVIM